MPIYEFNCHQCSIDFELLIRGGEKPACPECKSLKVDRQLSIISTPSARGAIQSAPERCEMPRCCGGGCQSQN
ncbi:MAG: zinc ribbon domain-containing protein [Mariniblastus sp.]|nr:zinc ribbon domain-containing protein [Mariniblastus sp.]